MKAYVKIILFLLFLSASVKIWAADDEINSAPPAVQEALQSVVSVNWLEDDRYAVTGTGFIFRDNNKAVLITAYHVIEKVLDRLDDIYAISHNNEMLKIKKVISYSKGLDVVVLELENYSGKGLKFSSSPSYNEGSIFVLRSEIDPDEEKVKEKVQKGIGSDYLSRKTFNIVLEEGAVDLSGFSGGPILNENGEVIGMLSFSTRDHFYSTGFKSDDIKGLLKSPKDKTSIGNQIPSWLHYYWVKRRRGTFLHKSSLMWLQAQADNGTEFSSTLLRKLDRKQFVDLIGGIIFANMSALSSFLALLNLEGGSAASATAVATGAIAAVITGDLSASLCAGSFSHFKNRAAIALSKNKH